MKKIFIYLVVALFSIHFGYSQVANFTFTQTSGTYTDLGTNGTQIAIATSNSGATGLDDVVWNLPTGTIPFNFIFDGKSFTGLNVSSNGFITFGTTAPVGGTASPISATLTYDGAISPWGTDGSGIFNVGGKTTEVRWAVVGTAPNREFVVQWKDTRPAYSTSTTNVAFINYQVRLSETSNVIKFVYGPSGMAIGTTNITRTPQIGLRGSTNVFATNVINRTNTSSQLFTASVAGTSNSSTQSYASITSPPGTPTSGLTYTFTPPAPPSCAAPVALTVGSITATTATVSWTAPASAPASGYQWEVRTSGAGGSGATGLAASGSTAAGVTTANVTTGLTAGNAYNLYVRSNCGGSDFSTWAGPQAFNTTCDIVSSFPWTEGFNSVALSPCWSNEFVSGTAPWANVTANGDASVVPYTGTRMAEFRTSVVGNKTKLVSPQLNLTGLTNPELSFYYANVNWAGDIDQLRIFYKTTAAGSWVQIGENYITEHTAWTKVSLTLPNKSATYYIAFEGTSNWARGVNVDDVTVKEGPTCFPPTAMIASNITTTSATLSWTAPAPAPTSYQYELRTSGAAGSGATGLVLSGNAPGTTVNLTPLTQATYYSFYVRSSCGADFSSWTAAYVFSTACSAVSTFPFTEGFEGNFFPPVCWKTIDQDNDGFNWVKGLSPTIPAYTGTGTANSASFDNATLTALTPDNWLITPRMTIPATGEYVLDYYVAAQDPAYPADKYGVYVSTTGTDPANFTQVFTEVLSSSTFALRTVNLFAYNGQNIYIAFRHFDCTDNFLMKIDDVKVRMLPPPCPTPQTQPTALVLTPTSNSIGGSFTASPTATGYLVLRNATSTLSVLPQNKNTYLTGSSLGNAVVAYSGALTTFTNTTLLPATPYYYFVFAYSTGTECSGPIYRLTAPLQGNVTTLPAAPASLTATATSNSQVSLAVTANTAGNNVLVAWNTTNVFGDPTGILISGASIPGGGTVHYVGNAAGLNNHSGLMPGTTYYYRAWTVVAGPKYSSTNVNANATTYFGVPYLQDFNASTSLPSGWEFASGVGFTVLANHGTEGSNGLNRNIWSSTPSAFITTPTISIPTQVCRLVFDYRIVNYTGFPNVATPLGPNDKVEFQVSTDGGTTYTTVYTINQATHVTSTSFANVRYSLAAVSGPVKFKILATWGEGDYYVDIDNFKVEVTPTLPIFEVNPTSKDFGTVSIFGVSQPQVFTFKNAGIGTLTLNSVAINGLNADNFVKIDANVYPLQLTEGQSATMQVYFDPTSAGAKSANIVFNTNLGANSQTLVPVNGVGFDPTITTFPFRESFEPTSNSRSGWLAANMDGAGTNWAFSTGQNHTPGGTTSAFHNYGPSTNIEDGWLISPPIVLPAGSDFSLSFWSYTSFATYYDKSSVLISEGSMMPNSGDYVEIWTDTTVTSAWSESGGISLADYAGKQIYIAFRYEGSDAHGWYFDDVLINTPLSVTYESTDLTCFGSNDGTITLNIAGGATPYTIIINGPDDFFSDQPELTGLAAGSYSYTVNDAEDVSNSGDIVLTQPAMIPAPTVQSLTVTYDGMLHTLQAVVPTVPEPTVLVWYNAASGGEVIEAPSAVNAGVYPAWVAALNETSGCESARVAVVLTINKKQLTVTADNKSKCQVVPLPELTFAYSGFVANEGPGDLVTAPVATTTATPSSLPGTYPITLAGGVSNNYSFAYVPGVLTVVKTPIISAGPDGAVCVSESFPIVGATASNYTTFVWSTSGNGTFSSTSALNPVYNPGSTDIANGSVVLTLTGDPSSSCSVQDQMTLTLQNDLPVSVTVVQITEDVCVGTTVSFTALPVNGGLTPAYQWKVNGTNAGTNSPDFAYIPTNNDQVSVVMTSSIGCALNNPATSAPVVVSVTADLIAGVSIFADATTVCDFTSVVFTAVPENGGSAPAYQWFVNGVAAGSNSSTLTYAPLDADDIYVVMTSSHACAVVPVATSNTVTMSVSAPYLELIANPINGGTVVGAGNYATGTEVTVVANPSPGWEFLNWKNSDGLVVSTTASYTHTINYCYEALTATFSSTAKVAGQLKYFNANETVIPSPNANSVFFVQLFEGETAIGERQLVKYNLENGLDSYFEYIGVESGKDYKLRVWEQATNNQLQNVWTWNNWGGVTAIDALIISFMNANSPLLTSLPWIAPVSVPNYTPYFSTVADINNSGSLSAVDALVLQYRMINAVGFMPLPGGAHNFRLATTKLTDHSSKSYPAAPQILFTPHGDYQATTTASDVYYEVMLNNLNDGLNVFNIYLVATGDLNASYVPTSGAKSAPVLNYNGLLAAEKGQEISIPVTVNQSATIAAMTLGFSYDASVLEVLDVIDYPIHQIDADQGTVRLAWMDQNGMSLTAGEAVVVVKVKVIGDIAQGSRYFELLSNTEFADVTATEISGLTLTTPYIETGVTSLNENSLALTHSSYPNPFKEETRINFTLPEAGKVSVIVYNHFGQEVKVLTQENKSAGADFIQLKNTDLRDAGTYFYRITLEGQNKTYSVKGTVVFVK